MNLKIRKEGYLEEEGLDFFTEILEFFEADFIKNAIQEDTYKDEIDDVESSKEDISPLMRHNQSKFSKFKRQRTQNSSDNSKRNLFNMTNIQDLDELMEEEKEFESS